MYVLFTLTKDLFENSLVIDMYNILGQLNYIRDI